MSCAAIYAELMTLITWSVILYFFSENCYLQFPACDFCIYDLLVSKAIPSDNMSHEFVEGGWIVKSACPVVWLLSLSGRENE